MSFIHFLDVTKQASLMVIRSFHAGIYRSPIKSILEAF